LNNLPNEEVIKNYRSQANLIKDELLQIALRKLESGSNPDLVVEELADKLTNKLLHKSFQDIKKSKSNKLEPSKFKDKDKKKSSNLSS
jgi:glutamyl-tRNA reductase